MMPIILVTTDQNKIKNYIESVQDKSGISQNFTIQWQPESKEFSIAQVREIIKISQTGISKDMLFILNRFDFASIEAQNALLKLLEEHQSNHIFLMVVGHADQLLPTIRSRSKIVNIEEISINSPSPEFDSLFQQLIIGDQKSMMNPSFQIKSEQGIDLLNTMLYFFRSRLSRDIHAVSILKEIITMQSLTQHNNLSAQTAIDMLLLTIHLSYKTSSILTPHKKIYNL